MSNSDTLIICAHCKAHVPRNALTCPICNHGLSSSQLRASVEKAVTPRGWLELASQRIEWLRKLPPTPKREGLLAAGRAWAIEFDQWERGPLPTPEERLPRLQAFSNWCGEVWKECHNAS